MPLRCSGSPPKVSSGSSALKTKMPPLFPESPKERQRSLRSQSHLPEFSHLRPQFLCREHSARFLHLVSEWQALAAVIFAAVPISLMMGGAGLGEPWRGGLASHCPRGLQGRSGWVGRRAWALGPPETGVPT